MGLPNALASDNGNPQVSSLDGNTIQSTELYNFNISSLDNHPLKSTSGQELYLL